MLPRAIEVVSQLAPATLLSLLAAFESLVSDDTAKLFHRGYAWFKFLRHWTSMRWDDTQGLSPMCLERRARGVYGVLERTKTSGPGKHLGSPWFPRGSSLALPSSSWLSWLA